MEDFTKDSLVLVTGANGHVAQHVVSQLLSRSAEHRPRVRATVRSEASTAGLKNVFGNQISSGELEIIYVSDIAQPGAFDEAVKGCTHIAHIASPLVVGARNAEDDVLIPALRGTTGLLHSALNVPSLKAVVITSSLAAVFDLMFGLRPGFTYTPEDWNPLTYETCANPNLNLSPWPEQFQKFVTYTGSKKIAEKGAWDLYNEAKPTWRLSTINPSYIGGPCILPLSKGADSLSFSNGLIWNVAMSRPQEKLPEVDFPFWVDVRDVAKAHVLAMLSPAATGQRFILAPNKTTYGGMAEIVRGKLGIECSVEQQELESYDVESPNCENILGIKEWISLEKMIVDTVKQVKAATP